MEEWLEYQEDKRLNYEDILAADRATRSHKYRTAAAATE